MEELTQKTNPGVIAGQADNNVNQEEKRRVSIQEGMIPDENIQSASQAVMEVLEDQCEEEVVKETQLARGKDDDEEVQARKDQNEGHWTPVQTRRKTQDCEFMNTVTQNWAKDGEGCSMFRLMRNLNRIRPSLIELNKRKDGGIDARELQAREKLDIIQEML
ncbi:hypothetical protein RIF29_15256 [Crotalaria pallida]|uniref:Uncharacterized protein n=1 Tax=Crotalaria pallida TaxID=3830 RepID=A0AAN9ICF8_CROPI